MGKHANQRSIESMAILNLKQGESFLTYKSDKDITAIANYYAVKVATERLLVINPKTTEVGKVVRVTIL